MTVVDEPATRRWVAICRAEDLTIDRGVAALVAGEQVAVFRLSPPLGAVPGAGGEVFALDHHDPYSGANVLARGLVGSVGERPTVASPIYKQRFDLRDGQCLDGDRHVRAWPVRLVDGRVEVGTRPRGA
ncbi:nitrite reductase small subunit NirD [soil metagenome]